MILSIRNGREGQSLLVSRGFDDAKISSSCESVKGKFYVGISILVNTRGLNEQDTAIRPAIPMPDYPTHPIPSHAHFAFF
jgi:hypothetical protein